MPFRRHNNRRRLSFILLLLCAWTFTTMILFWWRIKDGPVDADTRNGAIFRFWDDAQFDGYSEWEGITKDEADPHTEKLAFLREIISENLFSGFAENGLYALFEMTQPTVPSIKQEKSDFDYGRDGDPDIEGVADYVMWYENFQVENFKPPTLPRQQKCASPVQNIAFLKTHFTGSDVVTNILNRYGDLNNLHVALPSDGLSTFYWPMRFQWKYIDITLLNGSLPNILANHARYNNDVMDNILNPGSVYITILREPASQLETTFHNLGFAALLGINDTDPLDAFLRDPKSYIQNVIRRKQFKDTLNLIKNGQFFDLGLATTEYHRKNVIATSIQELYERFTIVLIYEHLDESLVLMKRRLCWSLDDIVYLKFHYETHDVANRAAYSEELKEMIRLWNSADTSLYTFFNKTLWQEIGFEGPSFWREVEEFRILLGVMESDCSGAAVMKREDIATIHHGNDTVPLTNIDEKEKINIAAKSYAQPGEMPNRAVTRVPSSSGQTMRYEKAKPQWIPQGHNEPAAVAKTQMAQVPDSWRIRRKLLARAFSFPDSQFRLHPDEFESLDSELPVKAEDPRKQLTSSSNSKQNFKATISSAQARATGQIAKHIGTTGEPRADIGDMSAEYRPNKYGLTTDAYSATSSRHRRVADAQSSRPFHQHSEGKNAALGKLGNDQNNNANYQRSQQFLEQTNENDATIGKSTTDKISDNANFGEAAAEAFSKHDFGSGYSPTLPAIDDFQSRISMMLRSQVSKWNRYFCKKLVTSETEYLDYFRRKHAYAKLATKR